MLTPCLIRISERSPFRFTRPVRRSNESEGMPYINTGLLTGRAAVVSEATVSGSFLVFSVLLHETKRTNNKIYFRIFRVV